MKKYPLIMGHGHGKLFDNDYKFIDYCNSLKPEIIEIDVCKSKDGVLFCYHNPYFKKRKNFHKLKGVLKLRELLKGIDYNPIIYLDLKDRSINLNDLEKILNDFKFNSIYLAAYSKKHLIELHNDKYKFAYQIPLFSVNKFLSKYSSKEINMVKLWRWNLKWMNRLKKQGFKVKISQKGYSEKKFFLDSIKLRSLYICVDDIKGTRNLLKELRK